MTDLEEAFGLEARALRFELELTCGTRPALLMMV
jgi:hypothetical protein